MHSYHEEMLHWIWETQHFDTRQIQTAGGQKVDIIDPGRHNPSDGPDFLGATIRIGNLQWHGDVEIHWKIADWNHHHHQMDARFNNVILHLVFEDTEKQACRKDGTPIPTLSLAPLISCSLQSFMKQYKTSPQLPCSGKLTFISEEAFGKQLQKAHKEYFEQKVDDLLSFYDPALPPSQAWKKMFIIALFDGLGISQNRSAMQYMARDLWEICPNLVSAQQLKQRALQRFNEQTSQQSHQPFSWNHKGSRPANHPRPRIRQGADCLWHIYQLSLKPLLTQEPRQYWEKMLSAIISQPSLGQERASILFGTVFLPAVYALGNLFFAERLKTKSWKMWQDHRARLPSTLLQMLQNTALSPSLYRHKLGTIHQLRHYCKPRKCRNCHVFKSVISS